MIRYLLDTNICAYIAKERPETVLKRFLRLTPLETGMSVVTFGELMFGTENSSKQKASVDILERLTEIVPVIPLGKDSGVHYARIRSRLERQGLPIGANDLWIAAHALELDAVLVTNNEREFKRVPHLKLENWV